MRRAVKLTLKFSTASKRRRINALLQAYRAAVNFYVQSLWVTPGKLDKPTLSRLPADKTRLSARYRSQALKQALETVVATKLSSKALGKPCSCPVFNGSAVLDAKFITLVVETGGKFDMLVKISSLQKGKRIVVPTRKTKPLNKWMGKPGARLVQGAALSEDSLVVWVEAPSPEKTTGASLGIDIGVCKLISDSNGRHYGREFRALRDKISRKKTGSAAKRRSLKERDDFVRHAVNQLPWGFIKLIAIEDLKNLKRGKRKGRGKNFRKAMVPWTYRQVIEAVRQKAEEHGVDLQHVPPAYTSRTCPQCGVESASSRKGEEFNCVACAYSADADTVGAVNVLNKALRLIGSVESPVLLQTAYV